MAASTFVHGKSGSFAFGGTTLNVTKFDMKHEVELADVTHTGAAGFYVAIAGIEKATGSVELVWDSGNVPTQAPQNIKAGQTGTLTLKPDGTSTYSFSAIVQGEEFSSGPKAGAVMVKANFTSIAAITTP